MKKNTHYICVMMILTFLLLMIGCANYTYAITPESKDWYYGVDVSGWQGYIDYAKVKKDRIDIVYMKSSEGRTWKDSYFETNYRNAKVNGLKVRSISFFNSN